jgi:ATP-binding cassette subfamily G (WHITE) protein 2 (SNQ2)
MILTPRRTEQVLQIKREYEDAGYPAKRLGVTWNNLTVKGKASSTVLHDTVLSLFNIPEKIKMGRRPVRDQVILDDCFGCVRPGQVLLVLGRPGAGCTTLLKMIANDRKGYSSIEGDMWYGNMDHEKAEDFRGEIVMNGEEVRHARGILLSGMRRS